MDRKDFTSPTKELQIRIKRLMTFELEKIAEREGVSDPRALVLLEVAKFIREKKEQYRKRGIRL